MRGALFFVPFVLAGCSSVQPVTVQGPAAAGALDCAISKATELGYNPVEGGTDTGFVRMSRRTEYSAGEMAQEAATRIVTLGMKGSNRQVADQIMLTSGGGALRVQVIGFDEREEQIKPNSQALDRAEQIVAACRS